ncbi:MAG: ABC transporter permease [Spirochaetales bacterium]|nr:ABC transporter permease [Spirochaetales bacterium]
MEIAQINKLKNNRFFETYKTQISTFIALIAIGLILSLMTDKFLTGKNLLSVMRQSSINSILAAGMTFVIISGGIDLSVGAIVALSTAIMGDLVVNSGLNPFMGMAVALLLGVIAGSTQGLIIAKVKIPPFIVTLGGMTVWRGVALEYVNGSNVYGLPKPLIWLGGGDVLGIPAPVLMALLVYLGAWFLLKKTKFGTYTYAIGGNEVAARLSGINIDKILVLIYSLNGLLCGVSGILIAGRINATSAVVGVGYELDAIAAVAIGGTSMSGGKGIIWGTLLGALVMGVIRNGLNLMRVSPYYQQIIIGVVIVGAVSIDALRRSRK